MDCLLTGASGFLGRSISEELSKGNVVFTLSRSIGHYKINLDSEIRDFGRSFDVVIHAAGKAHNVPNSDKEINEFNNTNVIGTLNLLKGLEISGVPKMFVFISSVSVYGIDSGFEINEESLLNAIDPYGKSKIQAEEIIKKWCNNHGVKYTILRLPLVIGANPPGNLGSMINAIRKGYYFNISNGTAKKSMVLASDIAKSIIEVAKIGGTYNLTDGYHPSFSELSQYIAKQLNREIVPNLPKFIAFFIAKIGDIIGHNFPINSNKLMKITSTLTFDDSKARKAFGWSPTPVLTGFKIDE